MQLKHITPLFNALLFVAVAVLGYGLTVYFDGGKLPPRIQAQAEPLPDFTFTDLSGKNHSLRGFKGKIIIINFWATWCPPCVKEFPALLEIAASNPDVILIALSSDAGDAEIKKFLRRYPAPAKNVFIARDHEDVTLKIFGISRLPETIIADRTLNRREKLIGAEWEAQMLQKIINTL